MIEILAVPYRQLELKRKHLLAGLESLADGQLSRKPGPQAWSILEVLEHLVLAEQLRPPKPEKGSMPPPNRRSLEIVSYVLNNDIVVGVPDSRMEPSGRTTYENLCSRWSAARNRLEEILENVTEETIDNPVSYHSVAGSLPPLDLLHLINIHVDHHQRQMERIRAEMGMEEGVRLKAEG